MMKQFLPTKRIKKLPALNAVQCGFCTTSNQAKAYRVRSLFFCRCLPEHTRFTATTFAVVKIAAANSLWGRLLDSFGRDQRAFLLFAFANFCHAHPLTP